MLFAVLVHQDGGWTTYCMDYVLAVIVAGDDIGRPQWSFPRMVYKDERLRVRHHGMDCFVEAPSDV